MVAPVYAQIRSLKGTLLRLLISIFHLHKCGSYYFFLRLSSCNWVQSRLRLTARVVTVICLINIAPKLRAYFRVELSIYLERDTCVFFSGSLVGNLQSACVALSWQGLSEGLFALQIRRLGN